MQAAAFGRRDQDVGLLPDGLQLQARTLQQPRKALLHGKIASKPGAVATADQGWIHRQVDPRQPGETSQSSTEAAGRHLIAAPGAFFCLAGRDE